MERSEAFRYSSCHPQNVKHPVVSLGVHTTAAAQLLPTSSQLLPLFALSTCRRPIFAAPLFGWLSCHCPPPTFIFVIACLVQLSTSRLLLLLIDDHCPPQALLSPAITHLQRSHCWLVVVWLSAAHLCCCLLPAFCRCLHRAIVAAAFATNRRPLPLGLSSPAAARLCQSYFWLVVVSTSAARFSCCLPFCNH